MLAWCGDSDVEALTLEVDELILEVAALTLLVPDIRTAAAWAAANPVLAAGHQGIESDTGVVRIGDGVKNYLSLSSGWRAFQQTAQITNQDNSVTVDIPGLAVPVQAGHLYTIKFSIVYMSADQTNGVGLFVSGPAQTFGRSVFSAQQGASGTDQYFTQSSGAVFGATAVSSSVVNTNTPYNAFVEGEIKPSVDGTFQLRVRPENPGNTATQLITVLNQGMVTVLDLGT